MNKTKDEKKFAGLIAMLDETFGKESSKLRVEIYFGALKEFEITEVEQAIYLAIGTLKFYPKPVELIELMTGNLEDISALAWTDFLHGLNGWHSVRFEDKIITATILAIFPSWFEACQLTLTELSFKRKEFIEVYKAIARNPQRVAFLPDILPGYFEIDNNNRSYGSDPRAIEAKQPDLICASYKIALPPPQEREAIPEIVKPLIDKIIGEEETK